MKPLISIIVPVYNAQEYIEDCLNSLTSQTYENIEILCTDDCSRDNSVKIIEKLMEKDSRIKLFKLESNSGPATARNKGLDSAKGEYIMFSDSDDTYMPNMCERMLNAMLEHDVEYVTCKSNVSNFGIDKALSNYVNCQPVGRYDFTNKHRRHINVFLWNKMYKKSLIDKYGIRFPDGTTGEDDYFTFVYTLIAKKYYGLQDKLYNYILRDFSFTFTVLRGKRKSARYDLLKVMALEYEFMKKHNLLQEGKDYYYATMDKILTALVEWNKSFWVHREVMRRYNKFISQTVYKDERKEITFFALFKRFRSCYWF